jgi:hypothetical protein
MTLMALNGTTRQYMTLYGTTWHYLALHGTTLHYMVEYGTIWHYMALHCTTWYNMVLYGNTWNYMAGTNGLIPPPAFLWCRGRGVPPLCGVHTPRCTVQSVHYLLFLLPTLPIPYTIDYSPYTPYTPYMTGDPPSHGSGAGRPGKMTLVQTVLPPESLQRWCGTVTRLLSAAVL